MGKKKPITSLSSEQTAKFEVYTKKWLKIGLSTDPIDFVAAKDVVKSVYQIANLSPPEAFYYARSPIEALKLVKDITGEKITHPFVFGAHDASWLSFYDFMGTELKITDCDKLKPLMELAKVCGWWIPFDKFVILEDRPCRILFDDRNRLHCEDGAAVEFRDGFAVYSWHGTKIPCEWITHKENLTPKIALRWENIEQRRCACEIIGWDKILKKLSAKTIDKDIDSQIGELVEVTLPDIGRERFLRVSCGTGRMFAIPVPSSVNTALEANAWTYDIDSTLYRPEIRT